MTKISQSHPALSFASDIADICKPLEYLNINYFTHVVVDNNNQFSGIGNNPAFSEHYIKNEYYNADIHLAKVKDLGRYVFWDALDCHNKTNKMKEEAIQFGVDHSFTIIDEDGSNKNYYHFASNLIGKSINQEYIRNLDLLKRFIQHFKSKVRQSKDLLQAYQLKFGIAENAPGFTTTSTLANANLEDKRSLFLLNTESGCLLPESIRQLLSARETQSLQYYVQGKTAKEISQLLGLSTRTVENYIYNIKEKLHVSTKAELIYKSKETDWS
jgi:DNA-binding CsgD family transcriptional regulator